MTGLPTLYWFGYQDVGYGYVDKDSTIVVMLIDNLCFSLVFVLSLGCYFVSFLKDLICIPRPYAPPVTRLSKHSFCVQFVSYEFDVLQFL